MKKEKAKKENNVFHPTYTSCSYEKSAPHKSLGFL